MFGEEGVPFVGFIVDEGTVEEEGLDVEMGSADKDWPVSFFVDFVDLNTLTLRVKDGVDWESGQRGGHDLYGIVLEPVDIVFFGWRKKVD